MGTNLTWYAADGSATDGTITVDIAHQTDTAGPTTDYETVTLEAAVGGPEASRLFLRLKLSNP